MQSREAVKTQTVFRFQTSFILNTMWKKSCKSLVANPETKYLILKITTKIFQFIKNISRGVFAKTKTTERSGIYYETF